MVAPDPDGDTVRAPPPPAQSDVFAPLGSAVPPPAAPVDDHATTTVTAMRKDEVQRVNHYALFTVGLVVLAVVTSPWLAADPQWLEALRWTSAGVVVHYLLTRRVVTRPEHLTSSRIALLLLPHAFVGPVGLLFFGFFSPVLMMIGVAMYVYAMAATWQQGAVLGVLTAFMISGGTWMTHAGILPDHAVVRLSGVTPGALPGITALTLICLGLVFVMARVNRRSTARVFEELESAVRAVARREALLAEARQDLEGALGPARRHGRWSGERAGAFSLGNLLGQGGMGEVYAATDTRTGARVAVKLLTAVGEDQRGAVERFFREADMLRGLKSPHVVEIRETGELRPGIPYIAMELLQGQDLGARLRARPQLDVTEALTLVSHVADALEAARTCAVVHRDLKPANVFLVEATQQWKVLDFGVARFEGSGGTLTQGNIVGTPGYMSPEQALGLDVDHRSDVFALGVIMYRVLTGRPAFAAAEPVKVLYDVVYRQPEDPLLDGELADDVGLLLALALDKDREQRVATARELSELLQQAVTGRLPDAIRRRARVRLAAHPWGAMKGGHG